jgi:peroxiredoxin Q/BCP
MTRLVLGCAALVLVLPHAAPGAEDKEKAREKTKGKIEAGQPAPDFTLKDQDGKEVKLSSFRGKKRVLIAFYPRDFTPGCTTEMKGFAAEHDTFVQNGVQVLGVSTDPVESHRKFCDSLSLPFPLLSDVEGKVSKLYGIFVSDEKGMRSGRSVFLVDREGKVEHADPKYDLKPEDDHAALLEAVKKKSGGPGKDGEKPGTKKTAAAPLGIEGLERGRITVKGAANTTDVVIDGEAVRERNKRPSRSQRDKYGYTPLTPDEAIPWNCDMLVIGVAILHVTC